ncbi:trithorax group protein osa-like [Nilaparvata lugens]|uniref:trithorax group protein osa-like n=1 Tax=Nilaparvata lugens TaxID=108931 RepID=UPI00193CFE4E|nr:trithorax group protein osa-like [Nilaparvata lugens]
MPAIIKTNVLLTILCCCCLVKVTRAAQDVPKGVNILKHINRVNDDGSYTFGYEADDGSFKIETRDVQGNVKGMFGYIDETGELKRVSYTASNGTGFEPMTTPTAPVSEDIDEEDRDEANDSDNDEDNSNDDEDNDKTEEKDVSTRRRGPVLVLRQPATSTRAPVIQHIPRKTPSDEAVKSTTPAYGDYIAGRKPSMDLFIRAVATADSNLHRARDRIDQSQPRTTAAPIRRILVTRRPVSEDPHHRESANLIRRQLGSDQASRAIDSHDVYPEDGRSRYIAPQARLQNQVLASLLPQASPEYRNQILAQNARGFGPISVVEPTFRPGFEPPDIAPEVSTVPPTPFPPRNRYYPENHALPIPRRFRPQNGLEGARIPLPIGADPQSRYDRPQLTTETPQISPILQRRPLYAEPPSNYNRGGGHDQVSAIQSLRDELMEYLLQYLQQRTGRANVGFQGRYPGPVPPLTPPQVPNQYYNPGNYYPPYNQYPVPNPQYYNPMMYNQYPGQFVPFPNQNQQYFNPYLGQNPQYPGPVFPNLGQYPQIPPIGQPFPAGIAPGFAGQAQLNNPNIQHSGQQSQQLQQVNSQILTNPSAAPQLTDARTLSPTPFLRTFRPTPLPQQDLSQQEQIFRTLVAASTRAPPSPGYDSSPTTELPKRSTQPIRNVQILGSASETVTQRVTTQSTPAQVTSIKSSTSS